MDLLYGTATPDNIQVKDQNGNIIYDTSCTSEKDGPRPLFYGYDENGEKRCWLGKIGEYHHEQDNIPFSVVTIIGRIWERLKIMSFWHMDRPMTQKELPNCLNDLSQRYNIDVSEYKTVYNINKNIVKVSDSTEKVTKAKDTSKERELHTMSPLQKKKEYDANDDLKQQRHDYFVDSDKAWINKHGNIDPAYYHMLVYQENKQKPIKLTESDIKYMVKESINKILKNR